MRFEEGLKGGVLTVGVVAGVSVGVVGGVEQFHSEDGVDVEEEHQYGEESEYDGEDLEQDHEDVFDFVQDLEFRLIGRGSALE